MTTSGLLRAFYGWAAERKSLVLATVYETAGSTYSKAGAQMLITGDGCFQGMLSGGCLEGDLADRARAVAESGRLQTATYDLRHHGDELWGLGVGCDGIMSILLQPLFSDDEYEPFASMARSLAGDTEQIALTVIESDSGDLLPGSSMVTLNGAIGFCDIPDTFTEDLSKELYAARVSRRSQTVTCRSGALNAKVLITRLTPPPAILVLGAGLDAVPVVRYAVELGWRVTVQDHRPAYIKSGTFDGAEQVHCVPAAELYRIVDLDRYAAAIIMSHHLGSDRSYLQQLAKSDVEYIGLLGPASRRRRLLEDLGKTQESLAARVHGPAGLDLGGRGPASIALSIIAEMHQHLVKVS